MTMTDQPVESPKPKKPRKYRKRAPRTAVAAVAAAVSTEEFPGLTISNCSTACNEKGCVITGRAVCGHPRKGGLQGEDAVNHAAVERYGRARKALAHVLIEDRG